MSKLPQKVSVSVRRLNPHLYGQQAKAGIYSRVARLPDTEHEQNPVRADAGTVRRQTGRESAMAGGGAGAGLRITITRFGRKLMDRDNFIGGAKALRDAIAESLGRRSDSETSGLEWYYNQVMTAGPVGTLVQIERVQ